MDSAESSYGPERDSPALTQAELGSLFYTVARTLIRIGEPESGIGFITPQDRPGALFFRINPDPSVIKDIFYPQDTAVDIVADDYQTYVSYTTPHATEAEDIKNQASTIYLGVGGVVKGTDITFSTEYSLTEGLFEPGAFTGHVETSFFRDGVEIHEDTVEVEGVLLMLAPEIRDMHMDDGRKIRRLLDHL